MRTPHTLLPPIILLLLLGLGAFWLTLRALQPDGETLASLMAKAQVNEEVFQDGAAYTIANGKVHTATGTEVTGPLSLAVLRLGYQKAAARLAPYNPLPGVDPQELTAAVAQLEHTADVLAAAQPQGEHASLVRTELYPMRYLTAAAEAERARQSFLQQGTQGAYQTYFTKSATAWAAYRGDIARLKSAFAQVVPTDVGRFATQGQLISAEDLLSVMDALDKVAQERQKLVTRRNECMGKIRECTAEDLQLPLLETTNTSLSSSQQQTAEGVRALLRAAGYRIAEGPLTVLDNSACVEAPAGGYTYAYEEVARRGSPLTYSAPVFVGDMRFYDSARNPSTPFYSYFLERGVRYIASRTVNYYACLRASADLAEAAATSKVASIAKHTPLSEYANDALKTTLLNLEQEFAGEIVREDHAKAYLMAAAPLIKSHSLPPALSAAAETVWHTFDSHSEGVLLSALDISSAEAAQAQLKLQGLQIDTDALYLFYTRSGFVSLYSLGAHTPIRLPQNTLTAEEQPFVYFSDLSSSATTSDKLLKDLRIYEEAHTLR